MNQDTPSHPAGPLNSEGPTRRWGRWLLAGTAAWAVLLLGLSYLSMRNDEPTVREQRSLTQAAPVVNRAIGELVAAAGPEPVLEMSAPRVAAGCQVSVLRDGATLERTVAMRTPPELAPALLDRLADRLPAQFRAGVRTGPDGTARSLRADAGEFVLIEGGITEPGLVTLTATTGCRPASSDLLIGENAIGLPIDAEPDRVLTALGATDVNPGERVSVGCPGGGAAYTVWATGLSPAAAPPPNETLSTLAGTVVATDEPELYAYRDGPLSVVVTAVAGDLRVAVTTDCAEG